MYNYNAKKACEKRNYVRARSARERETERERVLCSFNYV